MADSWYPAGCPWRSSTGGMGPTARSMTGICTLITVGWAVGRAEGRAEGSGVTATGLGGSGVTVPATAPATWRCRTGGGINAVGTAGEQGNLGVMGNIGVEKPLIVLESVRLWTSLPRGGRTETLRFSSTTASPRGGGRTVATYFSSCLVLLSRSASSFECSSPTSSWRLPWSAFLASTASSFACRVATSRQEELIASLELVWDTGW
mmetsp:Transcript_58542/g.188103  ORF Transcript_58542/g.188103 Transcript_58542/m.188103 type:complete len:207 (+) Transcript_58542:225-845(+)